MMHPAVFEWFRATIPAITGLTPFVETLSVMLQQTGLPPMWCTMEVDTSGMQRLTVGSPALFREMGTVTVVFVGKSGRGVGDLLRTGQAFVDEVRGDASSDPVKPGHYQTTIVEASGVVGTLRIDNVSSPDPAPFEDGNWMLCSVVCAYTYDSVRGAAA